ncbi:hypothetical protein [Bacillus sp. NPDC094106]|uniref:hypothetical protein n=1 Tax=Bacillus sp. NPDC094106 TaxID=3363949 RepID=UPI00381A846F
MLSMFKKVNNKKEILGALLVLGLLSWVGIEGALVGGIIGYSMYEGIKKFGISSRLKVFVTKKNVYKLALGIFGLAMVNVFGLANVLFVTVGAVGYYVFKTHDVKEQVVIFKRKAFLKNEGYNFIKTNHSDVAFKSFESGAMTVFNFNKQLNTSIHLTKNQVTALQNHTADDFEEIQVLDANVKLSSEMKEFHEMNYKLLKGDTKSFDVMFRVFGNGMYVFCFDGGKKHSDGIFLENVISNEAIPENTTTTALVVA